MPVSINIISGLTNTSGLILPIHQPTITPIPAQIGPTPTSNLLQQLLHTFANPYIQIPPMRMPNKMLSTTIIV